MLNDGIGTIAERAINPELQLQQFQQAMQNTGFMQDPQQAMPKKSFMPTLLGMGIGTAVGALGGYGIGDAVLGGITGGLTGYSAGNKRRNEYFENAKKRNDDILKSFVPTAFNVNNQAGALNNLTTANKTQTQMQSDMNMGDVLRNNLPPEVIKQPTLLYGGEQPVNPELENAKSIIKSYGGIDKVNQILQNENLPDNEREYIQSNVDMLNNPSAISGGVVTDNRPLMLAKPKDLETVTMRPLKQEKLKAEVSSTKAQEGQRKSATAKNNAGTNYIKKKTAEIGKSGGSGEKEWQHKEKQKAKLAELSQKWDAGVDAYKSGKISYEQLQKGRNTIRSSYGTIYTGNEKYFRLPSKKINKK